MLPNETGSPQGAEQRGVFALLRDLGDSGLDLARNTARMAASEARVVLHRASARLGLFAAGILVAASGLLLVLVGAALLLARVAGIDPWLAFAAVGTAALAAGAAYSVRALRRLSDPDLAFPATLAELEEDVEALRGGRDGNGKP